MKLAEAKKIMKTDTTKERENAFYTLYGVKTQKEVLEQFKARITALKVTPYQNKRMSKAKVQLKIEAQYQEQYIKLLELILEYSHAIFFLYSKERINKNFSTYRKVAIESIKAENVEKAFSQFKRIYNYKEPTTIKEPIEEPTIIKDDCLALEHISTLKSELAKDIKVMGGGTVEDKRAYIKFAIISLAIGITANDILDVNYNIDSKKSILDDKEYINTLVTELRKYQSGRKLSERGIRNGIDKLKLSMSENLHNKINKKYSHCRNFNHLIYLHKECQTSSSPQSQI